MQLYDTLSRAKRELEASPAIKLYVCGVTPYDTTHLGHAFNYASFDVLVRFLRYLGHEVHYAQNVTDIDDDILRRAKQIGVDWADLGRDQTAQYQRDMAGLNVLPPTYFPKATQETPTMIELIEALLRKGHAYRSGSKVFFAAGSVPEFGALAQLTRAQMEARFAETGDPPDDPEKRDRLDFLLWKRSAPEEPSWDSPWGLGRPGWHIECSAMATRYLGPRIDIHGGGDDLIFPHHSCEIAQSESATGLAPFAKVWMHVGAVQLDGVKMSKSLGNLVMARDLLQQYHPDAIRLYLHRHHCREPFSYAEAGLEQAARDAASLQRRVESYSPEEAHLLTGGEVPGPVADAKRRFVAALSDDLRTPDAVAGLEEIAALEGDAAAATLLELAPILGLTLHAP